jgi:hypothetical protein
VQEEAGIASRGENFAAVLDGLFQARELVEQADAGPSVRLDYLAVADELHSGRITVSTDRLDAEYRENAQAMSDLASEFAAFLDRMQPFAEAGPGQPEEKLPPVDAESIAAELGLGGAATPVDFSRLRRSFAFSNHPDRVAPHLRQRAMVRMQIANMLIDDARRKALAAKRR